MPVEKIDLTKYEGRTPGEYERKRTLVIDQVKRSVAIYKDWGMPESETIANATLFADAPKLLREIERLQAILSRPLNDDSNVLLNRCENKEPLSLAEQRELYEWLEESRNTVCVLDEKTCDLEDKLKEAASEIESLREQLTAAKEALDAIRLHGIDIPPAANYTEAEWWQKVAYDCMMIARIATEAKEVQ